MKVINLTLFALVGTILFAACQRPESGESELQQARVDENVVKSILTAEEQDDMSPEEIIGRLKKGNENFVNNNLTQRDHSLQRRKAMIGQYPKAIVLSCVDSRVPVEDIFDLGIGDIFVARVAGNIENEEIIGSMEFATAVAGSKLVIVMGHTACGAVKSTIDAVDAKALGMLSLDKLLQEIEPAVSATQLDGERSSTNIEFTNKVIKNNAIRTVNDIREASPTMAQMEKNGEILIVSAMYDMESGVVTFNRD